MTFPAWPIDASGDSAHRLSRDLSGRDQSAPDNVPFPMLLWMMSSPFEGNFGSEDSGQTNDGPLVEEGKLLSGHASSRVGEPGPWTGKSGRGQPNGRQAYGEPGPWSG